MEYARSEFPEGSLWVYVNEERTSTYGVKINMYRDAFNVNRGICEFTIIRAFNDFSNEIGETKSIVFEDVKDLKKYFVSSWSSKQNTSCTVSERQNKVAPDSTPSNTTTIPTATAMVVESSNGTENKLTGTSPICSGCWVLAECAPCFCGWVHKINDNLLCMYPSMCWMIPCVLFPICVESEGDSMVYQETGRRPNFWVGETPSTFRMHGGMNPKEGSLMTRLCSC
ncbi:hypothetical protein OAV88_01505 [bacterium]|nr:hypothetical protein [bacterium]